MQCIFQPTLQSFLVYYDGVKNHALAHPDEVTAINLVHKQAKGRDIPIFALGSDGAPWASRFNDAVNADAPSSPSFR